MKRAILGTYLTSILRAPDGAEGGGAGLSVTGDAELDGALMGRLGVQLEEPADKSKGQGSKSKVEDGSRGATRPTETEEQKAEREAKEDEDARLEKLVEETGKTKDEILAEEKAAADAQAEAREKTITERMEESGKSREEVEAELQAEEEAAAVQTPELSEEARTWVEEQIAAKDEEIATLKQTAEEATARVTELEQQIQGAGTQPLAVANIDPLFLIDDPGQLDAQVAELKKFEQWALANWDGVDPVEASEDGKTKAHPGFTSKQIRERYAQLKEVRETIVPAAREAIKGRKAHETQARKVYPELFDAKRPESKVAENLLKLAPGLKAVIPNIHIVIGDALRGEKIRLAEEKARKAKIQGQKSKVVPKVPAKPSGGAGTKATPGTKAAKGEEVVNTDMFSKLMEGGATGREALVAALT